MIRHALFASLALAAGCGRSEGVSDQELGGLVIAPKQKREPIDLAKAARDPAEVGRALLAPYTETVAALGPHTYSINTTNVVEEAGKKVNELTDHTTIKLGDKTAYEAVYSNSADYGREVKYVGTTLYLRPRYQRWHGRAPEAPEEPAQIRDSFFGAIGATWDLLAPAIEVSDQGTVQVAGRTGRKLAIRQAPQPRANPSEPLTQRKWREGRTIDGVTGEVVLDADKGVPLAIKLAGTVSFMRDGRRFAMKVSVDATASAIGAPVAVTAPPAEEVVATPERLREVDDRDFLLQGIAPPLRRNQDSAPASAPAGSNSGMQGPAQPDRAAMPKDSAKDK